MKTEELTQLLVRYLRFFSHGESYYTPGSEIEEPNYIIVYCPKDKSKFKITIEKVTEKCLECMKKN